MTFYFKNWTKFSYVVFTTQKVGSGPNLLQKTATRGNYGAYLVNFAHV